MLQGGLPAWLNEGYDIHTDTDPIETQVVPKEAWALASGMQWSMDEVLANIDAQSHQHIDARPGGRFTGEVPEPREGMRSGHVPNSRSLPFLELLTRDGPHEILELKAQEDLARALEAAEVDPAKPIVASCGSGMTAAHLALAMNVVYPTSAPVAIYDGSWAEWGGPEGTRRSTPVVSSKPLPS